MEYSMHGGRHSLVASLNGEPMRRMSGLQSLACCVVLLCSAGAPAAQAKASSDFTALYKLVPARADGFVAVDHVRLAKHKSASKLRNFVHDQGGARGLQAVVRLGLVPGKEILRSVSFNIGRSEADVVRGDFDIEALKVRAKDRLTKAFKEGSEQGHPWFTVTKGRRFVSLSEGTAVIGSPKMVTRVLARAAGKGKPLTSRKAFKALIAPAGKAKASLWGAGWVSKSVRDAMTGRHADLGKGISRTRFHAAGDADVEVRAATFTDSKATATALKALVESEVDRRFNSLTMKMLGVSALVKSASFTTKGKVLLMQMSLTPAQVDLVATTGGKVISILRAKRSK